MACWIFSSMQSHAHWMQGNMMTWYLTSLTVFLRGIYHAISTNNLPLHPQASGTHMERSEAEMHDSKQEEGMQCIIYKCVFFLITNKQTDTWFYTFSTFFPSDLHKTHFIFQKLSSTKNHNQKKTVMLCQATEFCQYSSYFKGSSSALFFFIGPKNK